MLESTKLKTFLGKTVGIDLSNGTVSATFSYASIVSLIIILVSISFMALAFYGSRLSLILLTDNMMTEVTRAVIERTSRELGTAQNYNRLLRAMVSNGTINLANDAQLSDFLVENARLNPQFTSLDFGLPAGHKYQARVMPDGSITRRIVKRTATNVVTTIVHANPAYNALDASKTQDLETGYDPRTRPWWKTAVEKKDIAWSEMYISGTSREFTVSNVMPLYDRDGRLLAVSTADFNLLSLSLFLDTIKVAKTGKVFIFNDRYQLVAQPLKSSSEISRLVKETKRDGHSTFGLYEAGEVPDQGIAAALTTLQARESNELYGQSIYLTDARARRFIAFFERLPAEAGLPLTIGVIVPESEVMEQVYRIGIVILILAVGFIVLAVAVGIYASRLVTKPLIMLTQDVDRISRLELDTESTIKTRILEVRKILDSVENMKKGLRSFKKYVPSELVLQLMLMRKEAVIEGERRQVTLFFSDIAGFTSISEKLTPEQLVENLGVYFDGLSRIIQRSGGTLDKYIGDAIMAFWGAPNPSDNHPSLACGAALQCREFINQLAVQWEQIGKPPFFTRIGIHTGEAIVGNMGYDERMNYTVLGDNVNLASRLEGLNKYYGTDIIVSEETHAAVGQEFIMRKLDTVAVKGREKGVMIYELVGARALVGAGKLDFVETFNRGIDHYLAQEWREAALLFEETYRISEARDMPSRMMMDRCAEFLTTPPAPDWTGIYVYDQK